MARSIAATSTASSRPVGDTTWSRRLRDHARTVSVCSTSSLRGRFWRSRQRMRPHDYSNALIGARLLPQVDAALDRVLVDLSQLLGGKREVCERRDVLPH